MAIKGFIIYLLACVLHHLYQMKRNREVYKIRNKWIDEDDKRRHKYTYKDMLMPNKKNWLGFRFPNEKHYEC